MKIPQKLTSIEIKCYGEAKIEEKNPLTVQTHGSLQDPSIRDRIWVSVYIDLLQYPRQFSGQKDRRRLKGLFRHLA